MKFCPTCGYQYDLSVWRPAQRSGQPVRKDDSKLLLIIVIVIVAVVILPIVLSAVLYFMVIGFDTDGEQTPLLTLTKTSIDGGVKFICSPPTREAQWQDVNVLLSDGLNVASWSPMPNDWSTTGAFAVYSGGPSPLGMITVWCNISDLAGNRILNQGDFFTFTTGYPYQFSLSTTYTVTLVYGPTGSSMCSYSFVG
jgi:hypothetical protein